MDKQNYIIKEIKKQDIEKKFKEVIKYISEKIEELGLIKRKRKIKSCNILIVAAYKHIVESMSYQRLSDFMAVNHGIEMSDTAWKKRLATIAPYFLEYSMEYLNEHSLPSASRILAHSDVSAIDTTELPVEGGKGEGVRVHTCLSLTCFGETDVVITDRHTAESVTNFILDEGKLYIADRAYGKAKEIDYAINSKADFLFRFSPNLIALYSDKNCKSKIDFVKYLSSRRSFSRYCYCKCGKNVHRIRIVGEMLPEDKQELADKRARRKSSKTQRQIRDNTLLFAKWLLLATSISNHSQKKLIQCYYRRWEIELHFKKLKSLLKFRKIRRSLLPFMLTSVRLWLAVAFLILSVRFSLFYFDYSEFNLFSLISLSFA